MTGRHLRERICAGLDPLTHVLPHRETTQLERIFEAAEKTGFPLFYSFDMLHWNKQGASDVMLNERLVPYAKKDTYHRIDGKVVISTFNGAQEGTYLDGCAVPKSNRSTRYSQLIKSPSSVSSFEESNKRWNELLANVKSKLGVGAYNSRPRKAFRLTTWPPQTRTLRRAGSRSSQSRVKLRLRSKWMPCSIGSHGVAWARRKPSLPKETPT